MHSSGVRNFALACAGLLAASLGLKAVVFSNPDPIFDEARFLDALANKMRHHGFAATVDSRNFVLARRGACLVKARDYPPTGALREVFQQLGREVGPTRFAYRGRWYEAPPTWAALGPYYIQRASARAGFSFATQPIVAVSATPACWATQPVWALVGRRLRTPG